MCFSLLQQLFRPQTNITLTVSYVGGNAVVTGRLTEVKKMTNIANANVFVTVTPPSGAVTSMTKVTDVNGVFTLAIPLLVTGRYIAVASYAGVANSYKPSTTTINIDSLAAAVATILTATPSAVSGTVGDTVTISVKLVTA
jgi:acetylglutamate kinase